MRIIGYERVSTARQGASGLGIEAQRQAIDGFVAQRKATLIARFTEVESGRNPDRPELGKALHLAKVTGATLVIAKLDRLSRNAAFLLTLRDSGVKFAAVDLPEANDLTVGIMALVAQAEREAISQADQGGAGGGQEPRRAARQPATARRRCRRAGKGGAPLRAAIARNADRHAQDLAPVVEDIRAGGATSLRAIAGELNARGMLTRRGGRWHVSTVTNLLDRLGLREKTAPANGHRRMISSCPPVENGDQGSLGRAATTVSPKVFSLLFEEPSRLRGFTSCGAALYVRQAGSTGSDIHENFEACRARCHDSCGSRVRSRGRRMGRSRYAEGGDAHPRQHRGRRLHAGGIRGASCHP